jgi:hypothetical protein
MESNGKVMKNDRPSIGRLKRNPRENIDESKLQNIYLIIFALITLGFLYFTALA